MKNENARCRIKIRPHCEFQSVFRTSMSDFEYKNLRDGDPLNNFIESIGTAIVP